MKWKRILLCTLFTGALTASEASAVLANGDWNRTEQGVQYLQDNGEPTINSWVEVQGEWYYLNRDGYMDTGWLWDQCLWYYLEPDGHMLRNTRKVFHGTSYDFDASGACSQTKEPGVEESALSPAAYLNESGSIFTNEWADYQITFPGGHAEWSIRDWDRSQNYLDFVVDSRSNFSMEQGKSLAHLMICYEDTESPSSDYYGYTPKTCLEEMSRQIMAGGTPSTITESVMLGGYSYIKLSLSADVNEDIYCREIGSHLMFLIALYSDGRSESITEILNSMQKVDNRQ
ncbi:hypothetical protein [Hungatella hominis]|uniref:Cell wall-binding protein n=1 Tax=Hungatella hominis TaxID=2763050 RepID=A0ABR7HCK0_9FIRM|nr:hypothetical protein [Hungatella hominis]MBC5710892.1 hypothetical protein [Hungatella hominis]